MSHATLVSKYVFSDWRTAQYQITTLASSIVDQKQTPVSSKRGNLFVGPDKSL